MCKYYHKVFHEVKKNSVYYRKRKKQLQMDSTHPWYHNITKINKGK